MIIPHLTLIFCIGCGTQIRQNYAIERERTLSVIPTIEKNESWSPDMRLRISYSRIGELCRSELQRLTAYGAISAQTIGVTWEAEAINTVKSVRITDHHIDEHFTIKANLDGRIKWRAGILNGSVPYSAFIRGRAKIEFDDGVFFATLEEMESLHVGFQEAARFNFTPQLSGWVEEQLTQFGVIELGSVDLDKLQVRAARVNSTEHTANLELRSNSAITAVLAELDHKPVSDWELQIAQPLAATWLRKATFSTAKSSFGIIPDPVQFSMAGSSFDLTLRLWNLSSINSWWRDYSVSGSVNIQDETITLQHDSIKPIRETGEGIRDPITVLSEGIIIDTIAAKLDLTVPNTKAFSSEKGTLRAKLNGIVGKSGALLISGDAAVENETP